MVLQENPHAIFRSVGTKDWVACILSMCSLHQVRNGRTFLERNYLAFVSIVIVIVDVEVIFVWTMIFDVTIWLCLISDKISIRLIPQGLARQRGSSWRYHTIK